MFSTKNIVSIAILTATLVVLGFIPAIPLGFIPIPIVLQNMGVMLIAVLLGGKKGIYAMLVFLLLGLFFPVFSGTKTLVPVLTGPTAGYVVAWVLVPMVYSLFTKVLPKGDIILTGIFIWLTGVLFVDVLGAIWLSVFTHISLVKSLLSNLVFIPLDTVKAVLATVIGVNLKRRLHLD